MPASDPDTQLSDVALKLVDATVETLRDRRGALLPILHEIQAEMGCVPEAVIPVVAERLNLTRAEVYGVVTFYADFRTEPLGRKVVHVCQAESCQALGSDALGASAKAHLGVDFEGTTEDGAFTLRKVYCLGNCALSPSVMIGGEVHGRVTPDSIGKLIDAGRTAP